MDKNYRSFANNPKLGDVLISEPLLPDFTYQDTLKFSNVQNGLVVTSDILGGTEDCVDINNRCENLTVTTGVLVPRGKYIATIKGGSRNIKLQGLLKSDGMVDLGNWSDQSMEKTTGVKLEFHSIHGPKTIVTVRVGCAEWPEMVGNVTYRKDHIGSFFLKIYLIGKELLTKK